MQQKEEDLTELSPRLKILVVLLNDVDKIRPSELVYLPINVCRRA